MEILRKLRWVLYPSVFILMFLFAAYCTFPTDVLREMAENSITRAALSMGPKKRGMPNVSLRDVALWRLSGMSLQGLKITWPPNKAETPLVLEFDSIKGRLGIFSLLTGSRSIYAQWRLYEGDLETSMKMRRQNGLGYIDIEASKINLGKMTFIEAALGAPLLGILNLSVDLNANSELSKDGTGSIKLNLENLVYGPGSVNLPAGGFTVPKISLGKLIAELSLDKGQLESKAFTLSGGDVEADLKLTVSVGRKPTSSRITGDGWFSVKREFVNTNETIKMLYDLLPELRAAQQGDGKVGFAIRGNLARPQFNLERYVGEKKVIKKGQVANQED